MDDCAMWRLWTSPNKPSITAGGGAEAGKAAGKAGKAGKAGAVGIED